MSSEYFICDVCRVQLAHQDETNQNKVPITRCFQDEVNKRGLIAVRCSQCASLPYKLQEGQPFRIQFMGMQSANIISGCNSDYNYFPYGIGHLLEVYAHEPSEPYLIKARKEPIQLGFLEYLDVNLIVVAYKIGDRNWNVTPYLWHAYKEWQRVAINNITPVDQKFTVAIVDTSNGKYSSIRKAMMPDEFAKALQTAIVSQITRRIPDPIAYNRKIATLPDLLTNTEKFLTFRCQLED